MKLSILAAGSLFSLVTCATMVAAEPAEKPTGAQARTDASKWLDGLGKKGLVLTERVTEGGLDVKYGPSALGRVTKFTLKQPGWRVSFTFRGEISADTPLATVRDRFWHAALDQLPTPGLDLPGWNVRPQTPVSSFKDGVEILAYGDGKITFRVRTKFFALYGRDPSVLVPADAASPPGSYFQIRKAFPLDLTLEAPLAVKE